MSLPPFIGTAFVQDDAGAASRQWRQVADRLRPKVPKLAALMEEDPEKTAGTHELAKRVPASDPPLSVHVALPLASSSHRPAKAGARFSTNARAASL